MKLLLFSIIYGAVHVRYGASTRLEPFRGWGNKGGSQKVPTSATAVLRDPTKRVKVMAFYGTFMQPNLRSSI